MTRRRTVLWTLLGPPLCGVLVACLVVAAWFVVGRPDLAEGETWFQIEFVGEAHYTGAPDQPIFFLAIGNDERASGPGGQRADSIHIIGVNPALGAATVIGIPRDTAVPIPGSGTDKINAALQYGGLDLQVQTVSDLVGVDIQYALNTNFDGFIAMVDEMGGVDVNVPARMLDSDAGSDFQPGVQRLTGDQALRFTRDRKSFPSGDVARSENQGLFLISALSTLRAQLTGSTGVLNLIGVLSRHAEIKGMSVVDLYRLGRMGLFIDPANVRNVVIPTGGGSGSNLAPGAGAAELFADFADDGVLQTH